MGIWIFKTEPHEFGISDLKQAVNATARWDGIRNYQARNFIRQEMAYDDLP